MAPSTGIPRVDGILTPGDCWATGASIAECQHPSGAIPWFPGGPTDPWDHVQAAMGLTVTGFTEEAERAYDWLGAQQRRDGTWGARYVGDELTDPTTDANYCAYVATGVLHHWRVTRDEAFLVRMWPVVVDAVEAVLGMQRLDGAVRWARDADGRLAGESLVTGNASIHLSLRCAVALAGLVGRPAARWEAAAGRLRHALDEHPEHFTPKDSHAMDWYYPVLGGALPKALARRRIDARREQFVVAGLGIRCVRERPWVTGAETCELVLALDVVGRHEQARALLAAMQHLRDPDGSYWTGLVYADGLRWPVELSTWTAATVLLAADALSRTTSANGLFRGEALPVLDVEEDCACLAS
ncbi:MAG: prenyltransferase [Dermatophilaceae bacterium]